RPQRPCPICAGTARQAEQTFPGLATFLFSHPLLCFTMKSSSASKWGEQAGRGHFADRIDVPASMRGQRGETVAENIAPMVVRNWGRRSAGSGGGNYQHLFAGPKGWAGNTSQSL